MEKKARKAKNRPPIKASRLITWERYCVVSLPCLRPGILYAIFDRLSDKSLGFNTKSA
jgi:hypothetical protein